MSISRYFRGFGSDILDVLTPFGLRSLVHLSRWSCGTKKHCELLLLDADHAVLFDLQVALGDDRLPLIPDSDSDDSDAGEGGGKASTRSRMPARFSSSSLSPSFSLLTLACTLFVVVSLLLSIASPFLSASLALRRRNAPLLQQLQSAYPYNRYNRAKFPTMIWQTWKDQVNSPNFDTEMRPTEETWSKQHPSHVHLVVDDKQADDLVNSLFSTIPQVYEAYSSMLLNVHRADFFRYLILFAYGGTYSDIDTRVLRPVWEWHPHDLVDEEDIGIIIGIEADPDRPDWHKWYARRVQFCQWTIRSKPGHPILARIIAKIVAMTLEMKANDTLSSIDNGTKISTMDYTGPGIWTDTVFEYLGDPKAHFTRSDRARASPVPLGDRKIGPLDVTGLQEQKLLGDVMLLPITSFSPGIGHMGSNPVDHRLAFVYHQFKGTWKEASKK